MASPTFPPSKASKVLIAFFRGDPLSPKGVLIMKRFALFLAALSTLFFAACTTGGPAPVERDSSSEEVSSVPTFTPYTVRPEIKNRERVVRAIGLEYPPFLRDQGIGGTVNVWFFMDEEGKVTQTLVQKSSGHKEMDDAALRVANFIRFTPASNRGKAVPVWISLPITFSTGRRPSSEADRIPFG
jgi:TonB family protein